MNHEVDKELLDCYARTMTEGAGREVAAALGHDPKVAVERAVVGTLLEPVLLAGRRMAQEDASARRPV